MGAVIAGMQAAEDELIHQPVQHQRNTAELKITRSTSFPIVLNFFITSR